VHKESYQLMDEMLRRCSVVQAEVLDVGSLNVNGTLKPLIEKRGWWYTGLDIVAGENVDVVASEPFDYPLADNAFDVVMSGSTMEHVTAIWRWLPELVRVLRPGGLLAIHTHWQFPEHRHPVDCWRVMPDGMRYLFDETGQLNGYDIHMANQWDIVGSAFKVTNGG
jgi:SAM-dependent methyltransferase